MTTKQSHPLCNEIRHWREVIQLRYKQFLESMTALELTCAEKHLTMFSSLLNHNMSFMKAQIDLLQNGDANILRIIAADYLILQRSLIKVKTSTNNLKETSVITKKLLRSEMVNQLDTFIRLSNIMIHHYARIEKAVFPAIMDSVSIEDGSKLASELARQMKQGEVESD